MIGDIIELTHDVKQERATESAHFQRGLRFKIQRIDHDGYLVLDMFRQQHFFTFSDCRVLRPSPFVQFRFADKVYRDVYNCSVSVGNNLGDVKWQRVE